MRLFHSYGERAFLSPIGDHLKLASRLNTLYEFADILGMGRYEESDTGYLFFSFLTSL